jgi:hypothetical protein
MSRELDQIAVIHGFPRMVAADNATKQAWNITRKCQ